MKIQEIPGWLSSLVPAFGLGRDPGVPGSSSTSGSLHGACFSLCLCLCLSPCVSHEQINKILKKKKKKEKKTRHWWFLPWSPLDHLVCGKPAPILRGWMFKQPIKRATWNWDLLPMVITFCQPYEWATLEANSSSPGRTSTDHFSNHHLDCDLMRNSTTEIPS